MSSYGEKRSATEFIRRAKRPGELVKFGAKH